MGPLESFLRSINCYPDHDQNRRKEAQKERRKCHAKLFHASPVAQNTLPPPPSLTGDLLDGARPPTGIFFKKNKRTLLYDKSKILQNLAGLLHC